MNTLHIGNLKVKIPIIQGGMGVGISLSGLASAVANEGGIGVISSVGIGMTEPDYKKNYKEANKRALKKEIRKARLKTNGIIGVNIMMAVTDFDDLFKIALQESVDIIFVGAGLLLKMPNGIDQSMLELSNTKIVPKVSSARAASLIYKYWSDKYNRVPDAIVIEGPEAGGHLGFKKNEIFSAEKSLKSILKDTIPVINTFEQQYGIEIPIIVGGGIYTGEDVWEYLKLGAKGVKIGTRFVTTVECDAADEFKQNYINCTKDDVVIIDSPVGLPGRVIINEFVKSIMQGKTKPVKCPWKCLKTCDFKKVPFCIADALFNAAKGNFRNGFSFAGANVFFSSKIITVKDTIEQLKNEYLNKQLSFQAINDICI
jgi:nitronate monooxygenase